MSVGLVCSMKAELVIRRYRHRTAHLAQRQPTPFPGPLNKSADEAGDQLPRWEQ